MIARLRDALAAALAGPRARFSGWLDGLQPRERRLVWAAAAVSAALVAWLGVVEPVQDSIATLDRGLAAARRDAASVGELAGRYRSLKGELDRLETSLSGDKETNSAFARLESIAVPIVGREKITAMNPSTRTVADSLTEESVEMRVEGIPMRQLVSLLYAIEQRDKPMHLARVSFKRKYKNPELVDATLVVSRLSPS
ncbi:MAG: type II secretion system protein GspM [Alphaproteobacteria bacterium]